MVPDLRIMQMRYRPAQKHLTVADWYYRPTAQAGHTDSDKRVHRDAKTIGDCGWAESLRCIRDLVHQAADWLA